MLLLSVSSVIDICNSAWQATNAVYYIGNPCYPHSGPSDAVDCGCEVEHAQDDDTAFNLAVTIVHIDINLCDNSSQASECLTSGPSTCTTCTGPNINFTAANFTLGPWSPSVTEWIIRFTKLRAEPSRGGRFLLKLSGM